MLYAREIFETPIQKNDLQEYLRKFHTSRITVPGRNNICEINEFVQSKTELTLGNP